MPEIISVSYASNEFSELPASLHIEASLTVVLRVRSSQFSLSKGSAGVFSVSAPEHLWAQLVSAVSSPEFKVLTAPQGVLPGEIAREIVLHFSDGTSMKKYAVDAPQAFERAEQALLEIETLAAESPQQALRLLPLEFPSSAMTATETTFRFTVTNIGQEPVRILDPKKPDKSTKYMVLRATGVSANPEGVAEQEFWELGPQSVASVTPDIADKGFLEIGSGEGVTFEVIMPPANLEGQYNMTLTYPIAIHNKDGTLLQEVELVGDAGDVCLSANN